MTESQKYYLMSKANDFHGGIGTYIQYIELQYNGQIKDLEEAFNKVVASQPMLRARVFNDEKFIIEDTLKYKIKFNDTRFDEQFLIEQKRKELTHKTYEIYEYPLFTMEAIGKNENLRVFISIDLLIVDVLSLYELMWQLKKFLSNPFLPMYDYTNELLHIQDFYHEIRDCKDYQTARDYYMQNIDHIYPAPQINYRVEQKIDMMFLRKECTISRAFYARLKRKTEQLAFSVTDLLLTIYILILSKWSKEQKLAINVTYFNLPQGEHYYKTIGNFASPYLLQTSFDFKKSLEENIKRAKLSIVEALKYRIFEVMEITYEMKRKDISATMPIVFTSMLFHENNDLSDDVFKLDYCVSQNPLVYLDCQAKNISGELNISWNYRSDMFESTIIDTMFSEYCSLIFAFLNSTEDIVSIYNYTKKFELISKYKDYNAQTCKTNFRFKTVRWHLEKTSTEYPENIFAIINNTEYTFRQVYDLANQKAMEILKIKKTYLKDKVRIAFNGKKNISSIICILAAILTNDSFCVINERFGEEKTEEILESLQNYIYFKDGELIRVSNTVVPIDMEEAYILHTSGTTGQPKGIIITEKAVLNTIYDIIKKFNITQKDTIMNISNLYFDLSIFDIFGAIISGMSIAFVDIYDHAWFFENNYYNKITIWNSTPALAKEFLLKYKFRKLRGILVSGDFVPPKMVEELFSKYNGIKLFALGGATEASIWSNYYDCSSYEDVSPIPYGLPLANQQLYVIDSNGEMCDFRVLGEICIAGDGLAKGYLSDEQTKASFVWNEELKEIVYKTGDLGYLGTDNLIYIVGRVASEIKHNGYRIDLREIEKYINMHVDVSNSVAFIDKMENGRTRLICAVVCNNAKDIKRKIRSELSKKLPLYMIPNHIILVSEIPLTGNGKVDIKSLCNMI